MRSPRRVEASIIVEEESGGEHLRLTNAFNAMVGDAWKEPLVRRAGDSSGKRDDIYFRLTDCGEKLWRAVVTRANKE